MLGLHVLEFCICCVLLELTLPVESNPTCYHWGCSALQQQHSSTVTTWTCSQSAALTAINLHVLTHANNGSAKERKCILAFVMVSPSVQNLQQLPCVCCDFVSEQKHPIVHSVSKLWSVWFSRQYHVIIFYIFIATLTHNPAVKTLAAGRINFYHLVLFYSCEKPTLWLISVEARKRWMWVCKIQHSNYFISSSGNCFVWLQQLS